MIKERKDYPIVLNVDHLEEILGISKRVAYELMDQTDFPTIRIGDRLKRVNRDAFFEWMDQQTKKAN